MSGPPARAIEPERKPSPVALVFVATNERRYIVAALESLFASTPRRGLEVVVVDNASGDGTIEEIRRRWPEVAVQRRSGRSGLYDNLNLGIAATAAAYVMLCNSDVAFQPGAIDRLADFLDDHPRAGMAAPRLVSPEGRRWPAARRWYSARALLALRFPGIKDRMRFPSVRRHMYADWDYASPRKVDWVQCPATLVRRSALEDVGPLDQRFRVYFGDVDLGLRMHQAGWGVWGVPDAEVIHTWQRASRRPLSRAWFSHLDSLIKFVWKHKGLGPGP